MTLRYAFVSALWVLMLAPLASAQANLSGIVINEILADPNGGEGPDFDTDGDGSSETDDEFVEFYNTTGAAVDISGWQVYQVSGGGALLAHTFESGTSIDAGGYIVVVGAWDPGTPPDGIVAASETSTKLGLTNGGDEVFLYDPVANEYIGAYFNGAQTAVTIGSGATLVGEDDFGDDADSKSIQRSPDGGTSLAVTDPSPNAANASVAPETYMALLLGANEVPPVETDAAGGVTLVLTGTELVVSGRFDDLESDYNTSIGSHLHRGAAGENGPVAYPLSPTLDADNRGGTFADTLTVRETFADSLRAGLVYVNVHTVDHPAGEIRGQVLTEVPTTDLTLRQARIVGPGYSITTTGTVSRAMGLYTYVQADGGGLTIRQTSGDFADDVADGTLAPGTEVTVTGMLSEFNGLLQINGGDLDSYTVGDAGAAPEATVVTLAQIAANGEEYESRLVTVQDVTFEAAGGTFAEGTNYDVADSSDDTNAVIVRIGDEGDTALIGAAIPSPAQVTGVIGEFNGDYQILPIAADDVVAAGTASEPGAESMLSLVVANPVQGATTVEFSVPGAGTATVALYDVLGRRVEVLATGEVAAGTQAARLDAGRLASGVYVLRLEAAAGAISKTITVVR